MITETNYSKRPKTQDVKGALTKVKGRGTTPLLTQRLKDSFDISSSNLHFKQEYDLSETMRIMDTESFVALAMKKKVHLIISEGFVLKCKKKANIDYVNTRLAEMEYVSSKKFSVLLEEIAFDLVTTHNVHLLKQRLSKSSTGLQRGSQQPLAVLYPLIPSQVFPLKNQFRALSLYKYYLDNSTCYEIDPLDMYHLYACKKPGMCLGTPPLEAVKDDIIALRQIEENLERLIYKNSSPLIHTIVGSETKPAGKMPSGQSEIDYYNNLVANMEDSGGITTSNRVAIKYIGAESQALRLSEYITYYKNRVLAGLSISEVDLGTGSSTTGGAADIISDALLEDVRMYQRIIECFFTEQLLEDLLLESPDYVNEMYIPEDERVTFKFKRPNQEEQIKLESHYANLVRFGLMSRDSFARETEKELPTPQELLESSGGVDASKGAEGAVETAVEPVNQHNASVKTDESTVIKDSLNSILQGKTEYTLPKIFYLLQDELTNVFNDSIIQDITETLVAFISKESIGSVGNSIATDVVYKHLLNIIQARFTEVANND